jgi:hypothetical protein
MVNMFVHWALMLLSYALHISCMCRMKLVFEINYRGKFDRKYGCIYVGGQVDVHLDNVDPDNVSFIVIEYIVGQYGYSPSDLIYFRDPTKDLVDGLQLVSSDYDVAYRVAKHVDTPIVVLYIVSFQNDGGVDEKDWENDEEGDDGGRVDFNDPWWDDKISDDDDVFEEDYLVDSAGPSIMPETDEVAEGDGDDGTEVEDGGESGGSLGDGDGQSGPSGIKMSSFEDVEVDENDFEIGRSDILLSPPASYEEDGGIYLTLMWSSIKLIR